MSGEVFAWEHGLTVEGQRMPRLSYNKTHDFGRRGRDHGGVVDSRALVLATDYAALQAKLDAVTKDAERLDALIDGRAGLVPIEGGAWDVYVYDEGGKETLLATRTDAREAIDAAISDQGRAGEGCGG